MTIGAIFDTELITFIISMSPILGYIGTDCFVHVLG